nr:hypothetical protein GCM10020093_084370 [Planobispora longispora]
MATFSIKAEVEFTAGVWTNISAYVRVAAGISIRRGRGDEQSEIQPGTMTLTLVNSDGRFTPSLATSPYYPNVRKGVGIRLSVVVGATTYQRFQGHVNEWPVEWEDSVLCLVSIVCTDLFKRLGADAPMRSLLEEEMLFLQPDAYYTLGEASGSTSAGDTSGKGQSSMSIYQIAGAGGSVEFGDAEGPGTDDLPAVRFTPFSATQGKGLRGNLDSAAAPASSRAGCPRRSATATSCRSATASRASVGRPQSSTSTPPTAACESTSSTATTPWAPARPSAASGPSTWTTAPTI